MKKVLVFSMLLFFAGSLLGQSKFFNPNISYLKKGGILIPSAVSSDITFSGDSLKNNSDFDASLFEDPIKEPFSSGDFFEKSIRIGKKIKVPQGVVRPLLEFDFPSPDFLYRAEIQYGHLFGLNGDVFIGLNTYWFDFLEESIGTHAWVELVNNSTNAHLSLYGAQFQNGSDFAAIGLFASYSQNFGFGGSVLLDARMYNHDVYIRGSFYEKGSEMSIGYEAYPVNLLRVGGEIGFNSLDGFNFVGKTSFQPFKTIPFEFFANTHLKNRFNGSETSFFIEFDAGLRVVLHN